MASVTGVQLNLLHRYHVDAFPSEDRGIPRLDAEEEGGQEASKAEGRSDAGDYAD
jgi:hypothetical protein